MLYSVLESGRCIRPGREAKNPEKIRCWSRKLVYSLKNFPDTKYIPVVEFGALPEFESDNLVNEIPLIKPYQDGDDVEAIKYKKRTQGTVIQLF